VIVKQIHIESVQIHDHTIAEIFCDQGSEEQAAILARISQTVLKWESWGTQCNLIAKDLKKTGMDEAVKIALQTLVDQL
jgi:hypothetical protein